MPSLNIRIRCRRRSLVAAVDIPVVILSDVVGDQLLIWPLRLDHAVLDATTRVLGSTPWSSTTSSSTGCSSSPARAASGRAWSALLSRWPRAPGASASYL